MKSLYNKKGHRRGEGERGPFAFFAVGAVVVLAAVFVIGLQVGRVIEKDAATPDRRGEKNAASKAGQGTASPAGASDIRKDLGSFSEETLKVPVVPPPYASSDVNEVEKKLTFQETLAKKEATTVPLMKPTKKDHAASRGTAAAGSGARTYAVQAGSFRDRKSAEACRKRLEKAGYAVRIVTAERKDRVRVFRVVAGPYPDVEAARKAVRRLKVEMKIDAFLTQGEAG
ncbi:MAG TPA: SPOR domain-containing protein [Candidatus Limnocylindrales bacterium]|nr:SPOR domain-containing protein [Candidatus Limnocylindrales bacterium]